MSSRGGFSGGGRDRLRREIPSSRSDDGSNKRGNNPPSRHLWIGNLSHNIVESDLTEHFLRFGELESVAFQPGRSYAFINFKIDEDAIAALKALQGFPIAGNPLRVEFAKSDKPAPQSRDEDYLQRRDDQRSALRGSPFLQRDSRAHEASPDPYYPDKSKMSDRSAEPSEVLWIGFPALLKVDEMILRKAFAPFGEIEKITVFPGRSYAFVRFRSVMSASRAKETLQGKLFGNPRVHICFAKNEAGSSNSGRTSLSPHIKPNGRLGASENFRQDRDFGGLSGVPRSPHFISSVDSGDSDVYGFNRKNSFDNRKFEEELGPPPDVYERHGSPKRERGSHLHDFSQKITQKGPFYEEPWDLSEDSYLFHGAKKQKMGSYAPEKELPEYPFSDVEQEKHAFPRAFSDFPQSEAFDGYKPNSDHPLPRGERSDHWKQPYDNSHAGSGSLLSNPVERKRFTPEPEKPSLNLWKWEGVIAKGGTPVCRARCFPVGKVLDITLPEFLDCTARTGLDMLAKHYYQAASAWAVFFVPASDADIGYYNEFMHYLGEKQRAAVAKLDEKTTLFLVPPSDFSAKVLKVPGDMSIAGVVLRLDNPTSNIGPLQIPNERKDTNLLSIRGDASYPRPSTPSGHFPSSAYFHDMGKSEADPYVAVSAPSAAFPGSSHGVGSTSDVYNERRHDYSLQQRPDWSPHHSQKPISSSGNIPSQASSSGVDYVPEYPLVPPRAMQENSSAHYAGGMSSMPSSGNGKFSVQETKPSSLPIAGLQPQQLVQLASSLFEQQRQSGSNISMGEDLRHPDKMIQSNNQLRTSQTYGLQNNWANSEIPTTQFGQLQQLQQQQQTSTAVPPQFQRELKPEAQGNPQMQSTSTQEEAGGDTQKRLQATLQLAAALLQQIQQGKST